MSQKLELAADQESLLILLRTKGLSIRDLSQEKKDELRELMEFLHVTKGLSLTDIAKLIGNKTSGYTSWLCKQLGVKARPFEEARLKGIREKRRKYERKPFNGTDEDRAYLLGLRHGDLSVSEPWKDVVRISTSTTHPAMARLFRSLFEPYGHVYQHPRFKRDTSTYEWNLSVILDSTFEFLSKEFVDVRDWLNTKSSLVLAYLAGFLDAEGSIITTRDNRGHVAIFLDYYNSDKALLDWINHAIKGLGYSTSLRINKKRGVRTKKYGIIHRSDYWQLSAFGMGNIQSLIASLSPQHPEKIRRRDLALSVHKGESYSSIQLAVEELRAQIKQEVREFVVRAEQEYKAKHGNAP